ncbi:MAG: LVIVD repeat-containing protein, partial [Candidatus Heimdallarchaeota archaeon]
QLNLNGELVNVDIEVVQGPVYIYNDFIFLKQWPSTIITIDISDLSNLGDLINVTDSALQTAEYTIYDTKLFVIMYSKMIIYDLTNPNAIGNPIYNWTEDDFNPVSFPSYITIANDIAYIVEETDLYIFDFSNLSNITYLNQLDLGNNIREMIYVNGYLYCSLDEDGTNNYFGLVDVSNSLSLDPMIILENSLFEVGYDVAVKDNFAYVTTNNIADKRSFLAVVDISNKELPEETSIVEFKANSAHQIAIHENTAFIGLKDLGLATVDISDPENPGEPDRTIYGGKDYCHIYHIEIYNDHLFFTYSPGLGIISLSDASEGVGSMIIFTLVVIPIVIIPIFIKKKRKN